VRQSEGVQFELLGPLRVVEGDRDLTPARPKQRVLLSMLLLHREQVVAGPQLIEALWGEKPPESAQTALHGHVSALRKLIGTDRIRTRPPGYVLQVSADEVDFAKFESLVARARERDDPAQRASCLLEALALWNGEPLADLRYEPFAQREIARLEELRLSALEERIDCDLALGRHHELVSELEPLVAAQPFRERLCGQLMLALYRCGRQADALHVLQSKRLKLGEELGLAPGPALQELERRILNQDPSLDVERSSERPPPGPAEPRMGAGAERKLATILLADVIGSTEVGERLDPERLDALLGVCFEALSEVVDSWGGTVEKHIGDAIVAVFGVPAAHENDPERALRASLELLDRLEELNGRSRERHGITLALRIGINTGEVVTGEGRRVAGDAVNVAARLEHAADPGTVLAGERTFAVTRGLFHFDDAVVLDVKGKGSPVRAHRLRRTRLEAELPAARRSPLVGRRRELARLHELLEESLQEGTPCFALVFGSAGIGKSRLVAEFLARAREAQPELALYKGRCLAAGRGITFWALAEILREALGVSLDVPAERAGEAVLAGARDLLTPVGLADDELDRTAYALATTAGFALPANPLDQLEPRSVSDELARAWARFATALASERPTILVIEDLHWAGEPLVALLDRLLVRSGGRLLVVATARPEFADIHPGFGSGREGVTSITLQALTEAESAVLVDGLLPAADVPDGLRRSIVDTAEGNPFFLEEIVMRLVDSGAIVPTGEGWRATAEAAGLTIPDTVHGVLAARIDALPPDEKRVLQEAAVIGRVFWPEPLALAVAGVDVDPALARLEERALVVERPSSSLRGHAEYQFKHALVRDVAYAALPKARRARAHAEHAGWIEQLGRRDELLELIAHHYRSAVAGDDADLAWVDSPSEQAALRERAFQALLEAGDGARRRFAIAKALELHEEALSLAADDVARARALAAIGDDHEAAYHGDEAWAAYQPALDLLRDRPGTEALRTRIYFAASRMAAVKWGGFRTKPSPAQMERFLDEGLAVAEDDEVQNWLTVLKGNAGLRYVWLGVEDPLPLAERVAVAEKAVEIAEELGVPELLSQAYRTYGLLQSFAGRWDVTAAIARRDLALADQLQPTEQAFALFWNALFLMEIAGEFAEHVPHAVRSLEVARALTPHERMHGTYTVMNATYHLGRWSEVERAASEHLEEFAKEPGIGCVYVRSGAPLAAFVLSHQGRFDRAAELAATFEPDPDKLGLADAWLARFHVARGDALAGRELAEQIIGRSVYAEENVFEIIAMLEALVALEDWDSLVAFLPEARAFAGALVLVEPAADGAEGLARIASGDRVGAEELLRSALAGFERLGVVFEAALTKERLAAVASPAEASRLRQEALTTYEQLGAAPHANRARAAGLEPATRAR
jgi:class 3 adenylate cyclase/DNA-binding winged helix-turn-helix (wHTH) protein